MDANLNNAEMPRGLEKGMRQRRSSLKAQRKSRNPLSDTGESSPDNSPARPVKRVSFARRNSIKPFVADDPDRITIWDTSYLEEVNHTDSTHSSNSHVSKVSSGASTITSSLTDATLENDTNCHKTVHLTNIIMTDMELTNLTMSADKENIPIFPFLSIVDVAKQTNPDPNPVYDLPSDLREVEMDLTQTSGIEPGLDNTCTNMELTCQTNQTTKVSTDMEFTCQLTQHQSMLHAPVDVELTCHASLGIKSLHKEQSTVNANIDFTCQASAAVNSRQLENTVFVKNMSMSKCQIPQRPNLLALSNKAEQSDMEFTCQIPLDVNSRQANYNRLFSDNMEMTCQIPQVINKGLFDAGLKSGPTEKLCMTENKISSCHVDPNTTTLRTDKSVVADDLEFTCQMPQLDNNFDKECRTPNKQNLSNVVHDNSQMMMYKERSAINADKQFKLQVPATSTNSTPREEVKSAYQLLPNKRPEHVGILKTEMQGNLSKSELKSETSGNSIDMEFTCQVPIMSTKRRSSGEMEFTCQVLPQNLLTNNLKENLPKQELNSDKFDNNIAMGSTCQVPKGESALARETRPDTKAELVDMEKNMPQTSKSEISFMEVDSTPVSEMMFKSQCLSNSVDVLEPSEFPARNNCTMLKLENEKSLINTDYSMLSFDRNTPKNCQNSNWLEFPKAITDISSQQADEFLQINKSTSVLKTPKHSNILASAIINNSPKVAESLMNLPQQSSSVMDESIKSKQNILYSQNVNELKLKPPSESFHMNLTNISDDDTQHLINSSFNGSPNQKRVLGSSAVKVLTADKPKTLLSRINDTFVIKKKNASSIDKDDCGASSNELADESSLGVLSNLDVTDDYMQVNCPPEDKPYDYPLSRQKLKDFKLKEYKFEVKTFDYKSSISRIEQNTKLIEEFLKNRKFKPINVPKLSSVSIEESDEDLNMKETQERMVNLNVSCEEIESLEDKVKKMESRSHNMWKLDQADGRLYNFSALAGKFRFVLEIMGECGIVSNIQTTHQIRDDQNPFLLYLVQFLTERLNNKNHLKSAIGAQYDVLSLLDYIDLTFNKFADLNVYFNKCRGKYGLAINQGGIATFKILKTKRIVLWCEISVNLRNLDHLSEDDISVVPKIGDVDIDGLKMLSKDCPKNLDFIKCFIEKIEAFFAGKPKRKPIK